MFDDAMGALQHIEDTTQNTDSEYYVKCTQAVQDLKNQQLELFEQWANMPTEAAEKKSRS